MTKWFKRRGYRHLDRQVCGQFAAKAMNPQFVVSHPFSPLIHWVKEEPRYKYCPKLKKRVSTVKTRDISYASHRDACILSYYAKQLNELLEAHYGSAGLSDSVVAYRALGKSNYHFSADALAFAKSNAPVTVLAFDVTGFFDNLDHKLLKSRLKRVLGVSDLPTDWFKVLRAVTKYTYVEMEDLKQHPTFGPRLAKKGSDPIATVQELKKETISFHPNPGVSKGVPQGTPISACLSNLYMIDFDASARAYCDGVGAMYRRYSDDILVICKPSDAAAVEAEITRLMALEKLELSPSKTERTEFTPASAPGVSSKAAQYLGFSLEPSGASIRPSSLSRQWRKMRRAIKRTRRMAEKEIAAGRSDRAWTKRLRRRFTGLQFRNFSSYGRRSAAAFGNGKKITRQVRRFEQGAEREIEELKKLGGPGPTSR